MAHFKFASIAVNQAVAAVDFGGGNVLHVTYLPDRLTTKFILEMSAFDAASAANESAAAIRARLSQPITSLLTLMASWDAYEDDGAGGEQPMPLDFDHLAALPVANLNAIFKAISEHQTGEASAPTDSAKA